MVVQQTDGIKVAARRWDSTRTRFSSVAPGTSLECIVLDAIQSMQREGLCNRAYARRTARYARCRVNGIEIRRSQWATTFPQQNARIEVIQGVKGGGGGGGSKNPVATVLSVVIIAAAAAATWYLGGSGGAAAAAAMGLTVGQATLAVGVAAAGMLYAVNALFPAATPTLSLGDVSSNAANASQVYSITGAKNTANPRAYIPLVCGKHRHTPPLGAKSWTVWEGDKQFFNMLVVWGHPDIEVTDFMIGDTPLANFKNVDHQFHQSTTGNDLKYFAKSYNEKSVGPELKKASGWVARTVGVAEDLSCDITFQQGLCSIGSSDGSIGWRTIQCQAQYRIRNIDAEWTGFTSADGNISISGAQTSILVKNLRQEGVPKGDYEMRWRRLTDDTDSQYIRDEATWSISRAIINQPAFNTLKPYCVSELRIQANEQLSSYVDDFNALCHSNIPDWDGSAWTTRTTSNPASIARYLLTSTHGLAKPYTTAKMDDSAWVALWNWCDVNGYEFNFICDSEQSTWARLVQVLAAGRAAPTTDVDGLWGAVIDRSGKEVKQLFTPRNSWGINCNRTFYDAPHALRVSFIDETDDYATKENFVFSDGYSLDAANGTTKATDIIEWDYPGVTSWEKIWRMGRYHLAKLLHRQMSVSINTDWEWLVCHRGDLVGIASDVLMNTYGTARIQRLVYDVDGVETLVGKAANIPVDEENNPLIPIGVQLDDAVIFSDPDPARYGLAVRYATGAVSSYEVVPVFDDEPHSVLYFKNPITLAQTPPFYGLCDVGVFGEEYEEYLLAGVQPGDNASAELTLIPYAATEIEAAASGAVPDYKPTVILDVIKSSNLPTPIIEHVRSDETVLIMSRSGGITSRIAVWWKLDYTTSDVATVQLVAIDSETGDKLFGTAQIGEGFVSVSNVADGKVYDLMIRSVSASGKTSSWSNTVSHTVVGKTSRPPDILNFTAKILDAGGVSLAWDAVPVLDVAGYVISGDASVRVQSNYAVVQVYKKTGTLSFSCAAIDTINLTSVTPTVATVTVIPPAAPVLTAKASVGGAVIRWKDCAKTWPIALYTIVDTDEDETYALNALELAMTPRSVGTYQFKATAEDKFQNKSATSTNNITVTAPANPNPTISIDGADIVVSWPMVSSFFPIDFYEVYTVDWTLGKKSKSNSIRFPATGIGVREFRVRAVDVAGNASEWVETSLTITAPSIPSVKITLNDNKDGCILSWQNTGASLPIVAWDVVRQWDNDLGGGIIETLEEDFGRLDVDSLLVPSVPVGEHHYMVRGIDSAGNRSLWGEVVFTATAPGKVTFSSSSVIDNNFLLYWTEPDSIFFAIAYYVFSEVDSDGYEMEIGRVDARFSSSFESASGAYTYRVTPVDVAGNRGESADISMTISQPPDFMLFHDYDSLFNGSKTNAELDGRGSMYAPVVVNETWQANADRVAALLSTTAANLTWQQKVTGGYEYYNSPYSGTGVYVETVDVGTIIPSTKITVTVSRAVLEGSPNLTCKIETSLDNNEWIVAAANAFEVYATNFRYVRYTFTVAGGLLQIRNINYRLNIKRKTDFGTVSVAATDNGAGYPGDPMQIGKQVLFNTSFTDVNGAPVCTIVNNDSASPLTPYTVFVDTLNPTGFRVFVLDKNGNRAAATVSWMVQGV